ncbi:MAG: glycine betaine/L-proline ABC transporter ATP-binding protein [Actinomycetes bacterium]
MSTEIRSADRPTRPASEVPVIEVRDLWKVFGSRADEAVARSREGASRADVRASTGCTIGVRDVGFSVARGETFVVMGLSGSGKSTLVRCLSRLVEPTSGQVRVDGLDLLAMDAQQLREVRRTKMSMVFQHFGLFPHRRVIDNVAYGLEVQRRPKRDRRDHAMSVLEKVGLRDWAMHYPRQLSGGMQQRVGLARALALDPDLLFFDEPFSALDPLIRRDMQDELVRLQREEQRTIVFITHDFAEAIRLGDRIAIMKDGEFDQIGTPEELVLHPATDYVREFVTDVPRERVLTARSVATAAPTGSRHTVSQHALVADVLPGLLTDDGPVDVVDDDGHVIGGVDRARVAEVLGQVRR